MGGNADTVFVDQHAQRSRTGAAKIVQIAHARKPERENYILALVPKFAPDAPIWCEPGHFLSGIARHGADQRHRRHLPVLLPCRGDGIRGVAEASIAPPQTSVRLFDAPVRDGALVFFLEPVLQLWFHSPSSNSSVLSSHPIMSGTPAQGLLRRPCPS